MFQAIKYFFNFLTAKAQPKIGDKITITWLPYNNGFPEPNAYIGMSGTVDYLYDNGGFCLHTGGSILYVTYTKYKYRRLFT